MTEKIKEKIITGTVDFSISHGYQKNLGLEGGACNKKYFVKAGMICDGSVHDIEIKEIE